MPHGWRFPARSAASPSACAKSDRPASLRAEVTRAFVDRTPINWPALRARVRRSNEGAAVDALRQVDLLRGPATPDTPAQRAPALPALVPMLIVAAAQATWVLSGALVSLAAGHLPVQHIPPLILTTAFMSASLLLVPASTRDCRARLLLATFCFAAAAFSRALVHILPSGWLQIDGLVFRGVYPEALAPAALWGFAVVFPQVDRFTRLDVFARRGAACAWVVAFCLVALNVLQAYGFAGGGLAAVGRDHADNLFWHLFVLSAVPALFTVVLRAYKAPVRERQKVVRLAAALALGAAPLLLTGVVRMTLPAFDSWLMDGSGPARAALDLLVIGALAAVPLLVARAVLVDRPFDLHRLVSRRLPAWLVPLVRLGRRTLARRLLPVRSHRERLATALDRLRQARGSREVLSVVVRELRFGLRAPLVRVVHPDALPAGSALRVLLRECSWPIVLARDDEPFTLLPRTDREWLTTTNVSLAAPIKLRDGTIAAVALLGSRHGAEFSRADRWFLSALLTAAAVAWDTEGGQSDDSTELARECACCGAVAEADRATCCDGPLALAAVPRLVNTRFTAIRRLGAGGMGVVYLALDTRLDRLVALKTLPGIRDGSVARLREEATTMAALNHEALATIYGLELWRGTPILVVEYFAGGTLRDRLAAGTLPVDHVLALGIRVSAALGYMHARGVLHRDVKPSNIGLTEDGSAKLLDFGLSGRSTTPAGTLAYLPPEALAGAAPDTGVDLWGLAVVLLEACGGRDRVPAALETFFAGALDEHPSRRFRSAMDMNAALVGVLHQRAPGER